jgi:hypothetical protein
MIKNVFSRILSYQRKRAEQQPRDINQSKEDKKRSVLFLHQSYYHYYYLAKALRKRGWDAIAVSVENPNSGVAPVKPDTSLTSLLFF